MDGTTRRGETYSVETDPQTTPDYKVGYRHGAEGRDAVPNAPESYIQGYAAGYEEAKERDTTIWLVTIKLPKNPDHNPRQKVTGPCAVSEHCTDVTGEHHTLVAIGQAEIDWIRDHHGHITRIERAARAK